MFDLDRRNGGSELLLRDAMEQLLSESFVRPSSAIGGAGPALDLYEDGEAYFVELVVPGLTPEQFELTLEQRVLTIKGSVMATQQQGERQPTYHLRERRYGNFVRSVALPAAVNADQIQATLEHGILTVRVPKAEQAKPKKISVKALSA